MKLYAIKYLSILHNEDDEPVAGIERKLFDTVKTARDHILNKCVPEDKKEAEDFYGGGDDEETITYSVMTGDDFVTIDIYEDADLVETINYEVVEVEYEAAN